MPIYRFGDFRLDLAARSLWCRNEAVSLPPKAFECIGYLVEHRDRAVGRDELISAVWGRVDISDNAVAQAIAEARRALCSNGRKSTAIRTVPRFGYQWTKPVEVLEAPTVDSGAIADDILEVSGGHSGQPLDVPDTRATSPIGAGSEPGRVPATGQPAVADAGKNPRMVWAVVVLVAILAMIGMGIWHWSSARLMAPVDAASTQTAAAPVLVLPADVDAPDSDNWAQRGIMDFVIDRLQIAGVEVVPSDNVTALLRGVKGDPESRAILSDLMRRSHASRAIVISARSDESGWSIELRTLHGYTPPLVTEGHADGLIRAAREAADKMARLLGGHPDMARPLGSDTRDLSELIQKIKGALLSGRLDVAKELLGSMTASQRSDPKLRYLDAWITFLGGHLDAAEKQLKVLLGTTSADDRPVLHARILNGLANIANQRNDYAAMKKHAQAAIASLSDQQSPRELGRALTGLAIAHAHFGDNQKARAEYAKARVALESASDQLGVARVDTFVAFQQISMGHASQAVPKLEKAAQEWHAFNAVDEELHSRAGLIYAYLMLLDPAHALFHAQKLEKVAHRISGPRSKTYSMLLVARAQFANGQVSAASKAAERLGQLLRNHREYFPGQTQVELPLLQGRIALLSNRPHDAVHAAQAGIAMPERFDDAQDQALLRLLLWRAWVAIDPQRADAHDAARSAIKWGRTHKDAEGEIYAELVAAELSAVLGNDPDARGHYEKALALAKVPTELLDVTESYAHFLLQHGDLGRASAIVGRVAAYAESDFRAALLQVRLYHALGQRAAWARALQLARSLAGEREIPQVLTSLDTDTSLDRDGAGGSQRT